MTTLMGLEATILYLLELHAPKGDYLGMGNDNLGNEAWFYSKERLGQNIIEQINLAHEKALYPLIESGKIKKVSTRYEDNVFKIFIEKKEGVPSGS